MTVSNGKSIEDALNWQTKLVARELIFQGVSGTKKINITDEMVKEAKAEALAAIQEITMSIINEVKPLGVDETCYRLITRAQEQNLKQALTNNAGENE